jgi:hypothetical protein
MGSSETDLALLANVATVVGGAAGILGGIGAAAGLAAFLGAGGTLS